MTTFTLLAQELRVKTLHLLSGNLFIGKYLKLLICILIISPLIFLISCKDNPTIPNSNEMRVFDYTPKNTFSGDIITVYGYNFLKDSLNKIFVDDIKAEIVDITDGTVKFIVPNVNDGDHLISIQNLKNVKLYLDLKIDNSYLTNVNNIILTDFFPKIGFPDDTLTLYGKFFKFYYTTTIYFQDSLNYSYQAKILNLTNDSIRVIVPSINSKQYKISVYYGGHVLKSYSNKFNVLSRLYVYSVSRKYALPNNILRIYGVGFKDNAVEAVYLDDVLIKDADIYKDSIVARIKDIPEKTYNIKLKYKNGIFNTGKTFSYYKAFAFSSIYPESGYSDDIITIYGTNLINCELKSVYFDYTPVQIIKITDSYVQVRVPSMSYGKHKIRLINDFLNIEAEKEFEIKPNILKLVRPLILKSNSIAINFKNINCQYRIYEKFNPVLAGERNYDSINTGIIPQIDLNPINPVYFNNSTHIYTVNSNNAPIFSNTSFSLLNDKEANIKLNMSIYSISSSIKNEKFDYSLLINSAKYQINSDSSITFYMNGNELKNVSNVFNLSKTFMSNESNRTLENGWQYIYKEAYDNSSFTMRIYKK